MSCSAWIIQMSNDKEIQTQRLLKEFLENSKSNGDKLTSARVVTKQGSAKVASGIKS